MNLNILKKHNDVPGAKKVFFVPLNTGQVDLYDAFMCHGFELYSLNFANNWNPREYIAKHTTAMGKIFLQACKDIQPDWVYFMMDHPTIPPEFIRTAKKSLPNAIFTNWTGDIRKEPKPGVLEVGKIVDITLIVSTGQIDLYKRHGLKNVEFLQAGIDTDRFFRMSEDDREKLRKKLKHDIVFCANNTNVHPGSPIRNEIGSKLSALFGSRCALYGSGWNKCKKSARGRIPYFEQNTVYNGSKIVISSNNFNDVAMYFSARQLAAMAAGTLTVSNYIPGLEKYFNNKHDLVWFKSAEQCIELVKYYLKHENEARQIGINGSKKVKEFHSRPAFIKKIATRLGFLEE